MANSVPVRSLYQDGVGTYALGIPEFTGEVFSIFRQSNKLWPMLKLRQLSRRAKEIFVRHGTSQVLEEHVPGVEMLGNEFGFDQFEIGPDEYATAHHDIAFADEDLAHFDIRQPVVSSIGLDLSTTLEERAFRMLIKAAQTAAKTIVTSDGVTTKVIHPGGQNVTRAGLTEAVAYPISATGAKNFRDDMWEMAEKFDTDNVPDMNRVCFINPRTHRVLGQDINIWDKDLSASPGDIATRRLPTIAGFQIVKTTNVPTTNVITGPTKYQGDYTLNVATVACLSQDAAQSVVFS
ncbi:MAG: hypothetical protein JKX85_15880 [Phycisphaeraceae bacterium]|nr:hypothetical protein [Phycisphaeraceae bacterium]